MELNKQVGNDNGLKEMYNIWWTIPAELIVINFIINTSIKTGIKLKSSWSQYCAPFTVFLFSSFDIIVQSKKSLNCKLICFLSLFSACVPCEDLLMCWVIPTWLFISWSARKYRVIVEGTDIAWSVTIAFHHYRLHEWCYFFTNLIQF